MAILHQIEDEVHEIHCEQNRVEKIKRYLSEHLAADLTALTVSKKFELSISSLQHVFKKHQHQTYQNYLEEIRMARAFELLQNQGKRVKEVLYATGYRNRTTFNNAFKKRFKYPPSHFQK